MFDLSIILPTCNRAPLLQRAIDAVVATVQCRYEIVTVDGASTDHTWPLLIEAQRRLGDRLQVIREPERRGFVKAINEGFAAAQGRYLMWLNDDARPLPGAIDSAVAQLEQADAGVGFLAFFHRWHSTRNIAFQTVTPAGRFSLCHVRGTLYANFPIGRRETWERLGFLDEQFRFCAADPDLSLKAWHAGLRVEPAWGCCLDHDEHEDDRRAVDQPHLQADNARLIAKWDLPPRNPWFNDFDPRHPCTLRGLTSEAKAA